MYVYKYIVSNIYPLYILFIWKMLLSKETYTALHHSVLIQKSHDLYCLSFRKST